MCCIVYDGQKRHVMRLRSRRYPASSGMVLSILLISILNCIYTTSHTALPPSELLQHTLIASPDHPSLSIPFTPGSANARPTCPTLSPSHPPFPSPTPLTTPAHPHNEHLQSAARSQLVAHHNPKVLPVSDDVHRALLIPHPSQRGLYLMMKP